MITLAQHLAAHWPTVHTYAGLHWTHMYQCKCGWMPPPDDPNPIEDIHAAHVADMLRQSRTITTIDQLDALPVETVVRELSRDGFVLEKYWDQVWDEARWLYPGDDDPQPFPSLPALVLWRPEDGDQ